MESDRKDPFISRLKNNLTNSSNNYPNLSMSNIPSINRNVNELLNDEELGKKIGRMETILNYYEAKLKNEFNERKILEDKLESLTTDVYHIKDNFENITKLFTDNFTQIKNNIMENVETKNNSLNKIVLESSKRINNLEDIILNNNTNNNNIDIINPQKSLQNFDNIGTNRSTNNSILFSAQRDSSFLKNNYMTMQNNKNEMLLNRINQLEKAVFRKGSFLGREEEINIGLTKINHFEKKFEIFLDNFNKDINAIKNNIKQNTDNIDNILSSNNILNEKFDNLYKTFNDTNINFNKFNYQTTLALNETQKKLEEYTDYFKNAKNDIQKRVDKYNRSQEIGAAVVRGVTRSAISAAITLINPPAGFGKVVFNSALTFGVKVAVDGSDKLTNGIDNSVDFNAKAVQKMVRSASISAAEKFASGGLVMIIPNFTTGSDTLDFALNQGKDILIDTSLGLTSERMKKGKWAKNQIIPRMIISAVFRNIKPDDELSKDLLAMTKGGVSQAMKRSTRDYETVKSFLEGTKIVLEENYKKDNKTFADLKKLADEHPEKYEKLMAEMLQMEIDERVEEGKKEQK